MAFLCHQGGRGNCDLKLFFSLPARAADFVIAVGTFEINQNMGLQAVLHRALPDGLEKPSEDVSLFK